MSMHNEAIARRPADGNRRYRPTQKEVREWKRSGREQPPFDYSTPQADKAILGRSRRHRCDGIVAASLEIVEKLKESETVDRETLEDIARVKANLAEAKARVASTEADIRGLDADINRRCTGAIESPEQIGECQRMYAVLGSHRQRMRLYENAQEAAEIVHNSVAAAEKLRKNEIDMLREELRDMQREFYKFDCGTFGSYRDEDAEEGYRLPSFLVR